MNNRPKDGLRILPKTRDKRAGIGVGLGVLLVATAATCAAETEGKNAPITQSRDNTAISATRKEFDTLKSSSDPVQQPKGDVPRFSVPDMSTGAAPGWTPPKASEPEKKSANWLVDAMQKPEARGKAGDRDRFDSDRDRLGTAREGEVDLSALRRDSRAREEAGPSGDNDAQRKVPTTTVVNPLAKYLGDWMTPQDYAVLKSNLAASPASPTAPRPGEAPAPSGMQAPFASPTTMPSITDPLAAAAIKPLGESASTKPRENPFLQSFNPPSVATAPRTGFVAPPTPVVSLPGPTPLSLSTLPPPAEERPRETTKSTVPDFAKPAQDEKYFKQLKRF